jgi:hypothetical protein
MLSKPPVDRICPEIVAPLTCPPELTSKKPPPDTVGSMLIPPESTISLSPLDTVALLTVWPDEIVVVVMARFRSVDVVVYPEMLDGYPIRFPMNP